MSVEPSALTDPRHATALATRTGRSRPDVAWSIARIAIPILVLGLLNVGLYTQLAPTQAQLVLESAGQEAATAVPASQDVTPGAQASPSAPMQLPYEADFRTALDQSGWQPFAGQWAFANGELVQQQPEEADEGITLESSPAGECTLRTRFHHLEGTGGGVLFDVPSRAARSGAQIVRYGDAAGGVFWGYLDQEQQFHGQGGAPTEPPGTGTHLLEVGIQQQTYSIRLDGRTLAVGVARVHRAGFVGLTTSRSRVAFESFEVLPAVDLATQLVMGPLPGARILAGDWSADGAAVHQHSTSPTDLVLDTGLSPAQQYRLDVTVDLGGASGTSDIGGGVLLGMPGRDTRVGSYLVRLAQGGRSVVWGVFRGDGSFGSIGGTRLDTPASGPRVLSVTVYASSFDVSIDGRRVAARVPFRRQGDGIGLVSVGGPVSFSGVKLSDIART